MNEVRPEDEAMTPDEAQAVARRRLGELTSRRVGDVAVALGTTPEEIARLLAEVRASRRPRRRGVVLAIAAFAFGALAVGAAKTAGIGPFRPPAMMGDAQFEVLLDGKSIGQFDTADPKQSIPEQVPLQVERLIGMRLGPHQHLAESDEDESEKAAAEGRWTDVAGAEMQGVQVRIQEADDWYRWLQVQVPVYRGDDAVVSRSAAHERLRRLREAADNAAARMAAIPPG